MRYAKAFLNHNTGVYEYDLKCIDIPVYNKSYFDIYDCRFPILCRIIKPGVLQDIITGEIIYSTITSDPDYELGVLSCEGYLEVSSKYVLNALKEYRELFGSYVYRMNMVKNDVLSHKSSNKNLTRVK